VAIFEVRRANQKPARYALDASDFDQAAHDKRWPTYCAKPPRKRQRHSSKPGVVASRGSRRALAEHVLSETLIWLHFALGPVATMLTYRSVAGFRSTSLTNTRRRGTSSLYFSEPASCLRGRSLCVCGAFPPCRGHRSRTIGSFGSAAYSRQCRRRNHLVATENQDP
jgi:hypothetical protein